MKSPRQEWYESDPDCSPTEQVIPPALMSSRGFGKAQALASIIASAARDAGMPVKKFAETLVDFTKVVNPTRIQVTHFDANLPTRPPHSMTPANNSVFGRGGRKRY